MTSLPLRTGREGEKGDGQPEGSGAPLSGVRADGVSEYEDRKKTDREGGGRLTETFEEDTIGKKQRRAVRKGNGQKGRKVFKKVLKTRF